MRTVRAFDECWQLLQERLRIQQQDLSHQVLHDDLTGLPNRMLLTDRLRRAASRGDRRGTGSMLLFLDLDNFKAINDRFGHPAGDALLTEVAGRLLELVRATDTVARLGGDEFVVLAEDLEDPDEAARSLAERIHQTMCAPVSVGERELHTSVSIGITAVAGGTEPDACLAQADAAMYRAKRDGPARFAVYDAQIGAEHQREAQLADELRVAHGRGELNLDYQPLFRLSDGVPSGIVGMEALLRWDHPELGSVPPAEFVPLLEQSRQIVPVGRWVLEEAAHQCVSWQRRGWPDLSMSVNVSARQLHDPGLYDDVREALERSGLDARPPGPGGVRVGPGGRRRAHRSGHAVAARPRRPPGARRLRHRALVAPLPPGTPHRPAEGRPDGSWPSWTPPGTTGTVIHDRRRPGPPPGDHRRGRGGRDAGRAAGRVRHRVRRGPGQSCSSRPAPAHLLDVSLVDGRPPSPVTERRDRSAVEPAEGAALGLVELGELGEQLVVDGAVAPGRDGGWRPPARGPRISSGVTAPRVSPAMRAAPRRLASSGSATCSTVRPSTLA